MKYIIKLNSQFKDIESYNSYSAKQKIRFDIKLYI